ncbi:hypothetical protein Ocin01_05671 [Orchesella cincta]|uniref:DUF4706 domain-containing protein n=1 Tax=Orchesella cincta TaxID=48709 RepID=A0A1D2N6W3_ORCCI|nr:hypothetical protein Ocin01_05671 [Orchesella cincta]
MGSSDLISEKFAMYFATMNPLASKIYADIEGIEDYIKSNGPPSITYSEKCSIVDKFMIHDHLGVNKNDSHQGKLNKRLTEYQKNLMNKSETSLNSFLDGKDRGLISEAELLQPVFYNDSTLDQDHESVLLTSVAPKKPEKYVYDDNNYWVDEHSGTYSSCTTTQAKACKLQQFLDSLPAHPHTNRRNDHPHKYRAPPIPTAKPEEDSYIIKPNGRVNDQDRYSNIDKMESEKSKTKSKYSVAVPVFGNMFGDAPPTSKKNDKNVKHEEPESYKDHEDLPHQVKNTDLIAELQAKLKKGKPNTDDSIAVGISPRSSAKINKPKAPPPPPPGAGVVVKPPGGAVKVTSNNESKKRDTGKTSGKKNKSDKEISDDFVVDVSSPCKIVTPKTGLDFLDNW